MCSIPRLQPTVVMLRCYWMLIQLGSSELAVGRLPHRLESTRLLVLRGKGR